MSSWKSLLLRIGEKCPEYGVNTDFKDHIETCSSVVRRELEHSGDDILSFLLSCAEQLPHKIPLYGTVVGLLNLENEDFVRQIVETAQTNLQDALNSGNCNNIRILMRFLTAMMCSKVLQPSSLVVVYETLLSSAATIVDEERGNPSWQACADFYITCILSCLPWGGAELVEAYMVIAAFDYLSKGKKEKKRRNLIIGSSSFQATTALIAIFICFFLFSKSIMVFHGI
ncbi:ARM repeat superfamily protein [Actinidia rufa]|uniref:ARM repeat superfamily protein n=1 Tax=Actinidia rufa TaxID=165716 RepID=A0A7J0G983_9ERIC|nr:ARM repeat superfamily protein [Actinidia rufa]